MHTQNMTQKLFTEKQGGMHAGSAEYTTFITSELINRKSGTKATRIAVLKKTERKTNKGEMQPIATMIEHVQPVEGEKTTG